MGASLFGLPILIAGIYLCVADTSSILFFINVILIGLVFTASGVYAVITRAEGGPSQDTLMITNLRAMRVASLCVVT